LLIRVFLISSNCLLLEGLAAVIASRPERFVVAGTAASPQEAGPKLLTAAAQLILLDVEDGRDHLPVLIEEMKAQCDARLLLLTNDDDGGPPGRAVQVLHVRGVIDRLTTPELLLCALEKVHEGQLWLDRATIGRLVTGKVYLGAQTDDPFRAPLTLLTDKERKILVAVVQHGGEPGKAIARKLRIGESTLRNHLTSIYQKLDVPNRNGLLTYAMEAGLIEHLARTD
jgi:DNA-binding NarL/FixJ family response regulator